MAARTHEADGVSGLSVLERRVCEHLAQREDDLVDLLTTLIGFNTVTHTPGAAPRDEEALQRLIAGRLATRGARVSVEEPEPSLVAGHRIVPEGFSFAGRPQLVARFPGAADGPTLLLNGHIDVVDVEPLDQWSRDPFAAVVRDAAVWGRGACDMKGGVACMVAAAEALAELDVPLAGDLVVNTTTDEESSGAGGLASARSLSADAAIVPEPSGLEVQVACRGSLLPTVTVEGRAGHAGIPPQHPDQGGPVNAIEKAVYLLEAVRRLREDWALRPRHPYLSAAECVPTIIRGGEWLVSYPARCRVECHIEYLPTQADAQGWGSLVEREFEQCIASASAADPWLRRHPPQVEWLVGGVPPAEVSPEEPVAQALLSAERDLGREGRLGGMDNWHDGAMLTVEAGIPAVCYGPGDVHLAHGVQEHVPVTDLVSCSQGIAVAAMRFLGVA
jgi:acetylornithine deacetylase